MEQRRNIPYLFNLGRRADLNKSVTEKKKVVKLCYLFFWVSWPRGLFHRKLMNDGKITLSDFLLL